MLNENIIQKLSYSYKSLFIEIDKVSARFKEISDCYKQLAVVSEKTNDVKF